MKKKQTTVEWLVRKLSTELIGEIPLHRWDEIRNAVQQALEMEKQQIINATYYGHLKGFVDNGVENSHGEQYYNETYRKGDAK